MNNGVFLNPNRAEIQSARAKKKARLKEKSDRDQLLDRISLLEKKVEDMSKIIESITHK